MCICTSPVKGFLIGVEVMALAINTERFEVLGDLRATEEQKDISIIFRNHSVKGLQFDEKIYISWRVVNKETGRTLCVFGGGAAFDAASVFKNYCEENY